MIGYFYSKSRLVITPPPELSNQAEELLILKKFPHHENLVQRRRRPISFLQQTSSYIRRTDSVTELSSDPTPDMSAFSTPSSRWAAVQSRNPLAASAFVYSVTTTKIYCRPTCPSRLARRANIMFHDRAAAAEADGFRACKRCRPESTGGVEDPQVAFVNQACRLIEKELEGGEKWSVKALAKEVGLTESHFCRVFKKVLGVTIGEYRSQITPKSLDTISKESPVSPGMAQDTGSLVPQLDPLSEIDIGNWNWSIDQYPLDPNETPFSLKEGISLTDGLSDDPIFGIEYTDLETAELPRVFDFSDQQHFDTWDDGNQFINYGL